MNFKDGSIFFVLREPKKSVKESLGCVFLTRLQILKE